MATKTSKQQAVVVKRFRDKVTGAKHSKGQVIEVTLKRLAEINAAPGGPFLWAGPAEEPDNTPAG
jgi:hypothetical protein